MLTATTLAAPELRFGDWRDVLADEECDVLISDPPYGARTHRGHAAARAHDGAARRDLDYAAWTPQDVAAFVAHWAPRTRGWFCAMTSHDLLGAYEQALIAAGRYVFAPIPCVIRGMTVRLRGDGPSNWTFWLIVARPRTRAAARWGTLPGAYVGGRGPRRPGAGAKPLWLMQDIIGDYSRPGDRICDPCAGYGTTLAAAHGLGRRAVGSEVKGAICTAASGFLLRSAAHDVS